MAGVGIYPQEVDEGGEEVSIAEHIDDEIREKIQSVKGNLLLAAGKLAQSQDMGYWKQLGGGHAYDKFKDYIDSLGGPSYSYMTRIMNVTRTIGYSQYTAAQVDEMGLSCAITLLPLIRKGEVTPQILHAALTGSVSELKATIKGTPALTEDRPFIVCPRCGEELNAKWTKEVIQ